MTDYKVTLKSNIQSLELNKKKVKVTCHNAKAGNLVITTLSQNSGLFGGRPYDIEKGLDGAKDFKVKYNAKDAAEAFYNAINNIISDPQVGVEAPEKSGLDNFKEKAQATIDKVMDKVGSAKTQEETPTPATGAPTPATGAPAPAAGGDETQDSKKKIMIIGGAAVLVLVLALVIWKARK